MRKEEPVCNREFQEGTYKFTDVCTRCGHSCISHNPVGTRPTKPQKKGLGTPTAMIRTPKDLLQEKIEGILSRFETDGAFEENAEPIYAGQIMAAVGDYVREVLDAQWRERVKEIMDEHIDCHGYDASCAREMMGHLDALLSEGKEAKI